MRRRQIERERREAEELEKQNEPNYRVCADCGKVICKQCGKVYSGKRAFMDHKRRTRCK